MWFVGRVVPCIGILALNVSRPQLRFPFRRPFKVIPTEEGAGSEFCTQPYDEPELLSTITT